jgi:hypothetical protein
MLPFLTLTSTHFGEFHTSTQRQHHHRLAAGAIHPTFMLSLALSSLPLLCVFYIFGGEKAATPNERNKQHKTIKKVLQTLENNFFLLFSHLLSFPFVFRLTLMLRVLLCAEGKKCFEEIFFRSHSLSSALALG